MAAKKRLLLWLAGAAVVLLALLALVLALSPAQEQEELVFLSLDSVSAITLEWPQETVNLELDQDGQWIDQDDPAYPIRQAVAENMAQVAEKITAQRQLEGSVQTGLDAPALVVTLKNAEQEITFSLGDSNSLTGDYYARLNDQVYTLDGEVYTTFAYTRESLYAPQTPMELEENLASVEISWEGKTLTLRYDSDQELWQMDGKDAQPDQTQVSSLLAQIGYTETTMTVTDPAQVARLLEEQQPDVTVTALGSQADYFTLSGPDQEGNGWLWDSSTGYLHQLPWENVELWLNTAAALEQGTENS